MEGDAVDAAVRDPYTTWSPLPLRRTLEWPGDARVALMVVVTLENMAWYPPADAIINAALLSPNLAYPRLPEIQHLSPFEYGNRVGAFRVLDVLDRYGVAPTAAVDATTAERCGPLVARLAASGAEFMGHGTSSEQVVTDAMPREAERALVLETLERVRRATGTTPRGWHSVDYSQSRRTIELLADAGLDYTIDWPNDEQPVLMSGAGDGFVNLPVAYDLDDVVANPHVTVEEWSNLVRESFDRLYADGVGGGRLLVLNIHPWLTGQPYRIRHFEAALAHVVGHPGVWCATGSSIVDWLRRSST